MHDNVMTSAGMIISMGILTFVIIMIMKIPVKKINKRIAQHYSKNNEADNKLYHRLNFIVIVFTIIVSVIIYSVELSHFGISHFKLCVPLKSGALAMAIYAVGEQVFKKTFDEGEEDV